MNIRQRTARVVLAAMLFTLATFAPASANASSTVAAGPVLAIDVNPDCTVSNNLVAGLQPIFDVGVPVVFTLAGIAVVVLLVLAIVASIGKGSGAVYFKSMGVVIILAIVLGILINTPLIDDLINAPCST